MKININKFMVLFITLMTCQLWSALGTQQPLAVLDFNTGESRNLKVVGKQPSTIVFNGYRLLDLNVGRVSVPLTWSANMPNPGFPGLAETISRPKVEPPKLVLDLEDARLGVKSPVDLALIITVYDYCRGNSNTNSVTIRWTTDNTTTPAASGSFNVSGDPYAVDTVYRPRLIRKTIVMPKVVLKGSQNDGDFEISPANQVYLQRIEVYQLPKSPLDDHTSRREPGMISYPNYLPPKSILDLWRKDFSDVMVEQTQALATWADADAEVKTYRRHLAWSTLSERKNSPITLINKQAVSLFDLVKHVTFAMDALCYEGKVALIREDKAEYQRLLTKARSAITDLEITSERTQAVVREAHKSLAEKLPQSVSTNSHQPSLGQDTNSSQPLPSDRLLFTAFANSPWDYWDPFNGYSRFLQKLEINTRGHLLGALSLDEHGDFSEKDLANYKTSIDRERANGWDVVIGVGHHGYHLCEHGGLPDWLVQKSSPDSVYDVSYTGQQLKGMDIWNPHVRQYFLDSLTALARETLRNPHVGPLFYFGEPLCGTGYSSSARRAFIDYLRSKYLEISKLNTMWDSNYETFAEIQPPPPPGVELRVAAKGLTYEFEKFRRDSFTQWWKDAALALRKGNPRAKLWFEGWGRLDYLLNHGMDQLALFGTADFSSVHAGGGGDMQRIWGQSLSRYSGTPVCDGETLVTGDYYQGFASLEQLRAASEQHLLSEYLYGARLFMFWADTMTMRRVYSYSGPQLYDQDLPPVSSSAAAIKVLRRKSDLYDPLIKGTEVVHPQVGILFSSTSFINSWPYNEVEHETYPIHSWLYQSDFSYLFAHEDAIADGREDLRSFRVLFAPWAMWLQPKVATALLDWVKDGGVLVSSGPVGAFDPYGKPLNTLLEAALGKVEVTYDKNERTGDMRLSKDSLKYLRSIGNFNTTHFGGWSWTIKMLEHRPDVKVLLSLSDGTPVLFEVALGYGKVIFGTGPIGKNGLRQLAMHEVERKVIPLVRKTRDDAFHVVPRRDLQGNLYLGVFNKNVNETVTDTLYVDGRYQEVFETSVLGNWPVPTTFDGGRTAITLALGPGEVTLLSLGPQMTPHRNNWDLRQVVQPEASLVALSFQEALRAKRQIDNMKLEPAVRAEALSLFLAAGQQAILGYRERARRLLTLASQVSNTNHLSSPVADTVIAKCVKSSVKIDGLADEWREAQRYIVKGSADEGGEFALQWDTDNLYVLVVARDNNLRKVEENGGDYNWIWNYDGISIVLNAANSAPLITGGALYDFKYRATQTALLVSITGRKYANSIGGFSAATVRSAVKEIEGGYVMELAIPLRGVMLPPIAGANVGFEFRIVNDGHEMGFGQFSERESWSADSLHFSRLKLVQ